MLFHTVVLVCISYFEVVSPFLSFDIRPGGHAEVDFNNVRVHKSNLLVKEGTDSIQSRSSPV